MAVANPDPPIWAEDFWTGMRLLEAGIKVVTGYRVFTALELSGHFSVTHGQVMVDRWMLVQPSTGQAPRSFESGMVIADPPTS